MMTLNTCSSNSCSSEVITAAVSQPHFIHHFLLVSFSFSSSSFLLSKIDHGQSIVHFYHDCYYLFIIVIIGILFYLLLSFLQENDLLHKNKRYSRKW